MDSIFNYLLDTTKIYSEERLKDELLKQKVVHNKYKNIIRKLNLRELKNFVYVGIYDLPDFEGVGYIFISICQKDLNGLIKYILKLENLKSTNILRLMVYTLQNYNKYNGKFLLYIKEFKTKYEKRFKSLLFELGKKYYIDKLDLINLFKELLLRRR